MAIQIRCTRLDDGLIMVNGKEVRKDMNENWIAKEEMSVEEAKFFNEFRDTAERLRGRNLTATYTLL